MSSRSGTAARADGLTGRLAGLVEDWGATVGYTVHVGPATRSLDVAARVAVMPNAVKFSRFTEVETTAWALPAYTVTLAGDFRPFGGEPAPGDLVLLPGEAVPHTLRKAEKLRLAGRVVRTLLYVAR